MSCFIQQLQLKAILHFQIRPEATTAPSMLLPPTAITLLLESANVTLLERLRARCGTKYLAIVFVRGRNIRAKNSTHNNREQINNH
jgi:hypothetical protein